MTHTPAAQNSTALIAARWLSSAPLRRVFAALDDGTNETRVIGGAVRNALLKLPVADIDLATQLTPEMVIERAMKAGLGVYPTGLAHGTVTVVADGTAFEVTTLRRDTETDGRHAVVAFTTDWPEDAQRRDFTINALSCDANGTVFDFTGGLADIAAGHVRFIGMPGDRIREDYLRILRFFRFTSAYAQGAPDAAGLTAAVALKEGMGQLSAERIGAEMMALFVTPRAGDIAGVMHSTGILRSIVALEADPDCLARFEAIERALGEAPDAIARLAALFPGSAKDAAVLAARFRLSNADAEALAQAADVNITADPSTSEAEARAQLYRFGRQAFGRATRVAWARSRAPASDPAWRVRSLLATRWSPPKMPFAGTDVLGLGIAAGPRVGRTLRAFEAWWIDAGFPSDRTAQRERLAGLAEQS